MRLRGRERPEISLANNSIHGHLCVTAFFKYSTLFAGKAKCSEWSGTLQPAESAGGRLLSSISPTHPPPPMAAAWQQLYRSPVQY